MEINKICVIGLGYIGLPTAAVLASHGKKVLGIDIIQNVVDTINSGNAHIVERDLDKLVKNVVKSRNLRAETILEPADVFLIAVPTPFKDDNKPDISYIKSAVSSIAPVLEKGNLVILESTSPVGTTEKISKWLAEARPDLRFPHHGATTDINIAYCPERVLPGQILKELVENDRIVGGITSFCAIKAIEFYKIFVKGICSVTDSRTAEMVKLTENTFRDVNIAFANEISLICDQLEIDVWKLISFANMHPRVDILQPGPGVGGHCIAVDPWFIVDSTPEQAKIIQTARKVNDDKPKYVVTLALQAICGMQGPKIACLGLAYKPNIDDLRESPALKIVLELSDLKVGNILVSEPNINKLPSVFSNRKNVKLTSAENAIRDANVVLLLVNHEEYNNIDHQILKGKKVIDTIGVLQRYE